MLRIGRFLALGFAVSLGIACSSSNNSNGGGTGTSSSSSGSSSGSTEAGTDAGPEATGACAQWLSYEKRCASDPYAGSEACYEGRLQNCSGLVATWSSGYTSAIASCVNDQTDCNDGPGTCIDMAMQGTQPNAIQQSIRTHFCATCTTLADCQNAFYLIDPQNGDGPGVIVFQLSDALAQQVDQQCTQPSAILDASAGDDGGTLDCSNAFAQCVADLASSALPDDPDSCFAPSTGDDGG